MPDKTLRETVFQTALDVAAIKAVVLGDNGLPQRVRALETWRGRIGGQAAILAVLLAVAVTLGGALIARL